MGKTTEDTAMELDGEGAANFEQLQDLIQKECDKRDSKYARLEDKCNKLEQQVKQKIPQKNMTQRGRSPNHEEPGSSKKNKSNQRNARKCLECILVTPTATYKKQVDENKRLLTVKKLSNEIIMGKTTKDTVMELDGEGAANFEQLQVLIQKECDKRDRKYARLEDKCNKLEQQVTQKNLPKNMSQRGQSPKHEEPGASKKNKSIPRNAMKQQRTRPKSAPVNNSGATNRRNSESPGQAAEKNSDCRLHCNRDLP